MAASPTTKGVLDERRDSPGMLLALLGQDAMRRLRTAHTEDNLSPRQFHLLALLHDSGPIGQTELGQSLATDPSVLVTQLNPLEDDGLISRQRDPADRRRHVVRLTKAGDAKLKSSARAQRRVEEDLFAGLDEGQREQLRSLLVVLRDSHGPGRSICSADDSPEDC